MHSPKDTATQSEVSENLSDDNYNLPEKNYPPRMSVWQRFKRRVKRFFKGEKELIKEAKEEIKDITRDSDFMRSSLKYKIRNNVGGTQEVEKNKVLLSKLEKTEKACKDAASLENLYEDLEGLREIAKALKTSVNVEQKEKVDKIEKEITSARKRISVARREIELAKKYKITGQKQRYGFLLPIFIAIITTIVICVVLKISNPILIFIVFIISIGVSFLVKDLLVFVGSLVYSAVCKVIDFIRGEKSNAEENSYDVVNDDKDMNDGDKSEISGEIKGGDVIPKYQEDGLSVLGEKVMNAVVG